MTGTTRAHLPLVSHWLHHDWPSTTATVTACEWKNSTCDRAGHPHLGHYCLHFTYVVDGTTFTGLAESPVWAEAGSTFPIRFDPRDPRHNTSDPARGFSPSYIMAALLVLAILYVVFEHHH
jgi:hypothetical protein